MRRYIPDLNDATEIENAYWDERLLCSPSTRSDILRAEMKLDQRRTKCRELAKLKSQPPKSTKA